MTPPEEILAACDRLLAEERIDEAIAALTAANLVARSALVERRLVEIRHEAFKLARARQDALGSPDESAELQQPLSASRDPFPDVRGRPPEIELSALDVDVVRGALGHHGCLIVRGLIDSERAAGMAEHTSKAMDTAATFNGNPEAKPDAWYAPMEVEEGLSKFERVWSRECGTLYGGDCPRVLFELIEIFREVGLDRISRELFGERTAISLQKCAVRQVEPVRMRTIETSMWHQDGRFLGEGVRALNVWIAFTEAGVVAPGMDVVPRRLEGIVTSGTGSAGFDWTVGEEVVHEVAGDTPVMSPSFAPGDAIFFDELFLHTSSVKPGMDKTRLSSECWFIAESTYPPEKWVPLTL